MNINHHQLMARAVVRHQVPTHDDFAIVSMNPLLGHALQFGPIREVILKFLEEHMRFEVRDIQPTHLGQALVHFVHVHDRDILVNHSPYPYDDVQISFARHNQGRNWRTTNINRECWLTLMDFPLEYWNSESIQSAIDSFGKMLI
jgi:hypothetical protein